MDDFSNKRPHISIKSWSKNKWTGVHVMSTTENYPSADKIYMLEIWWKLSSLCLVGFALYLIYKSDLVQGLLGRRKTPSK